MPELFWVKMPSEAFRKNNVFSQCMSSGKNISSDIAALKIFVYACLFSERTEVSFLTKEDLGFTGASLFFTYDDIESRCKLSRALISRGIQRLVSLGIILRKGGPRKFEYIVPFDTRDGWCKLPKMAILNKRKEIIPFLSMINRTQGERDALKIFLYLLSIRENNKDFSFVSASTIAKRTGVPVDHIKNVFLTMSMLGLLVDHEFVSYVKTTKKIPENEIYKLKLIGHDNFVKSKGNFNDTQY
tara:strand:+ start:812 stop:1540 length:729 start_codon:yes stop_codon:yes gene_type:complete